MQGRRQADAPDASASTGKTGKSKKLYKSENKITFYYGVGQNIIITQLIETLRTYDNGLRQMLIEIEKWVNNSFLRSLCLIVDI